MEQDCKPVKLGFQLKSVNKRRKQIQVKDADNEVQKEMVTSIEGKIIKSVVSVEPNKQLVIPLPKSRFNNSIKSISEDDSLNKLATDEIIAELTSKSNSSSHSQLSIIQTQSDQENSKWTPMLLMNQAPELVGLKDEEERFKVDISLRPDAVDVNSESYINIPIEEYGAAMLRGMGWTGPKEDDKDNKSAYDINPREYRLGLGALPKPPDANGKKTNVKKEEELKKWQKKVEKNLKSQHLVVGSFVWLRDPHYVGQRAVVTAVHGVPGLDRIRVILEKDSSILEIKRLDAVLLTEDELLETPFQSPVNPRVVSEILSQSKNSNNSKSNNNQSYLKSNTVVSMIKDTTTSYLDEFKDNKEQIISNKRKDVEVSSKKNRDTTSNSTNNIHEKSSHSDTIYTNRQSSTISSSTSSRSRNEKRKDIDYSNDQRYKENASSSSSSPLPPPPSSVHKRQHQDNPTNNTTSSISSIQDNTEENWITTGIRVRIITDKIKDNQIKSKRGKRDDDYYLKKGRIINIYINKDNKPKATVQLDDSEMIIEDIKQRYLETVLPSAGSVCKILKGRYKGIQATLLEKNKEQESVLVEIKESSKRLELKMSDIAAMN